MNIDVEGTLQLDTGLFVGRSAALLGITGSGKTNTAAVLIEEMLTAGLPMTIVDIEGEYYGLKQQYDVLVAGKSDQSELLIGPENAAQVAEVSLVRGISVILDLSDFTQEESAALLGAYFARLWEVAGKERKPYQIIIEEAHEWVPQGVRTPLKALLTRIALRGRKRGLGIILMSQRSAKVEKDVLTQTSLLFLHKVVHPIDMKVYKDLIPLPPTEVERTVGALGPGQIIAVSNHIPTLAQIRVRSTFHAGSTPVLGENVQPELRKIDQALLQELEQLMGASSPASDEARLEKRVKELEEALRKRDAEIAKRDEQIALLSQLSVTMNGQAAQLPEALHITQANIDTATVHQVQTSPLIVEATAPKQVPPPINEAKIRLLQKRLSQLSTHQQRVFRLLVEQEAPMTVDAIAAWLGVAKRTAQSYLPPDALFKIGLIQRSKSGKAYVYRATLKEHCAKEFPGANQQELLRRVLGRSL